MFVLKAFAADARLVSNDPGVVNAIGELSTLSQTYARDKGIYRAQAADPTTVVSFTCAQDSTPTQMSSPLAQHVMSVVKAVYDYVFANPGQIFSDALTVKLATDFGGVASSFVCGQAVTDANNNSCVEWVQWSNTSIGDLGANTLKVWFSDLAFQAQYDDYVVVVVPPLTVLNDFFKTPTEVQNALDLQTPTVVMDRVQAAKQGYPETIVRALNFSYHDPFITNHLINTTWYVLIYGEAGNNPDAINEALVQYVLANSTHTRTQWSPLLPDMFRRTEFVLVPLWDQYAIANMLVQAGIYSPVANLKRVNTLMKAIINDPVNYPLAHIDAYLCMMSHPYKSLQILSLGNPTNREGKLELTEVYPDILSVSSTSIDFNRMHALTKEFLNFLAVMLPAAEDMTAYTTVPPGMSRVTRNGKLYLSKRIDNIDYLVLAKSQLTVVEEGV